MCFNNNSLCRESTDRYELAFIDFSRNFKVKRVYYLLYGLLNKHNLRINVPQNLGCDLEMSTVTFFEEWRMF